MRKVVISLVAAGSLLLTNTSIHASVPKGQASQTAAPWTSVHEDSNYTYETVEKASTGKATAKNGSFKTKHNTNVRADAGTKYKVVTLAKKGSTATATHQKKVGKEVWYKVKVNGKSGWVLSTLLTPAKAAAKAPAKKTVAKAPAIKTPVKKASNTATSSQLINNAKALIGTPYKFGGSTKSGFDCSGFVQYVFNQSGKSISRSTLTQFAESTKVTTPQAGDLVFFAGTYRAGISHVGIYIGNNQFIHAGGSKTEIVSMNNSYWKKHFHSYKRR